MRIVPLALVALTVVWAFQGCSKAKSTPSAPVIPLGVNMMSVSVGCGYIDEPCVSVTICVPGTSTCQTISNLLLDTGSYGLRLFSSAVSLNLTTETDGSGHQIAECTSYADGTSQWGPIKVADVELGEEKATNVPIEIVDSTFQTAPASCTNLDTNPAAAGYNGILGVGLLTQDCGAACQTNSNNAVYYGCSAGTCSSEAVSLTQQVTNPVSMLPFDNNGVILSLPAVGTTGASSDIGTLTLGIDTQSDNSSSTTTAFFTTNSFGDFETSFGSTTYGPYNGTTVTTTSFIDSGSNGLYFPDNSIATCAATGNNAPGFYCPASTVTGLTATQKSNLGLNGKSVTFEIANANNEASPSNPNIVFDNIGAPVANTFDWGLPFFLGRTVYVGISGKTSNLGTGPYWAW